MNMVEFLRGLVGEEVLVNWYPGAQASLGQVDMITTRGVIVSMNETLITIRMDKMHEAIRHEIARGFNYVTLNLEDAVIYAVDTVRSPGMILSEKEVKKR